MERIKDKFPLLNGLFVHINYTLDEPFNLSSEQLDILFLSHYGMRYVAPLVTLIESEDFINLDYHHVNYLTNEQLEALALIILRTYRFKWEKLFDIAKIKYLPIYNYYDELQESKVYANTDNISQNNISTENQSSIITQNSIRTDNLTNLTTNDLTETRTDNLTNLTTNDLTETRTDNLTNLTTNDLAETRTDNLTNLTTNNLTEIEADARIINNIGTDRQDIDSTTTNGTQGFNSSTFQGATNSVVDSITTDTKNMSETHSGNLTTTNTGTTTTTNTGTQLTEDTGTTTTTNTGTQLTEDTGTTTTTNTGTQLTENTGTTTTTNTGTQNNTLSNTNEVQESSSGSIITNKDNQGISTRVYTKFGNIGNIATQDLIKKEIELWQYNFINQMLKDVAELITLPIY